jgi:2-dehydropantoate 2-reductase
MPGETAPNSAPTALVIGSGALGALIGCALRTQCASISVVCRSDYEAVSTQGFTIESVRGTLRFQPDNVYRDPSAYPGAPNFLVVAVKVTAELDSVALIRQVVGPGTCIVIVANGIGIDDPVYGAFPDNEIASVVAYVAASRVDHGKIVSSIDGHLVVGTFPEGLGSRTRKFASICTSGGLPCRTSTSIHGERWKKAVWNAVVNPLSVLNGGADTRALVATAEQRSHIAQGMEEVCAIARAAGFPMPREFVHLNIEAVQDQHGARCVERACDGTRSHLGKCRSRGPAPGRELPGT